MPGDANIRKATMMFLGTFFLFSTAISYADQWGRHEDRHFYHYSDHPHFGLHVNSIPGRYYSVRAARERYFYYDGLYYHRTGGEYIIVEPPVGAIVYSIPTEFQPVSINGVTYYTNNGIYYVYTRQGYEVVPKPVIVYQYPAVKSIFTVKIPDKNGGYTMVLIKKSGKGFVGPQGEFYPEFPKVSRLKMMYGTENSIKN